MLNPLVITKQLSFKEYERYAKQIIIQEINSEGQKRINKAKVLFIGAGGLNTTSLLYLSACGIGTIGIIDYDIIEISNLQRQIIYETQNINQDKIKAAYKKLESLNPLINIRSYKKSLNKNNIKNILYYYDIVIDGTDSLNTRYLISQYCNQFHKIHIYGAINTFTGQVSVFNYQNSTNYYNLYNIYYKKAQACNDKGIINTLAGIIGLLQATEVIKIITGIGSILNNNLLVFNLLNCSLNKINIEASKIPKIKLSTSNKDNSINKKKYLYIQDIKNSRNKKYKLIDIRKKIEFNINHINGAINIPLSQLKRQKYIKYIKNLQEYSLVIYCNNETRSYIASKLLTKYKIDHYILKDGIKIK